MKTIPGTALVEMGDEYAVKRAVTHLNNVKLFGKDLMFDEIIYLRGKFKNIYPFYWRY